MSGLLNDLFLLELIHESHNILLAIELGFGPVEPFFEFKGRNVSCLVQIDVANNSFLRVIGLGRDEISSVG
jgi:hypothetical protein